MARVLIVDDDPKIRSFVSQGLGESGHRCEAVGTGEDALERVREGGIDLVLLDVMLPGMQGWDVQSAFRAEGLEPSVIFVTARDEVDERVRGLQMGGDDYVVKPFAFVELQARVEAVLRRRAAAVTRVGRLVIDNRKGLVTRDGVPLDLTPTELGLLRRLAESTGEPVSRTLLLESVWGIGFDPGTNMVEVHIRRLRKKLDEPFDAPMIHTVRGQGYALDEREP
jgi:two-component system copper resistance phosphate regulon response regulator CusR